MTYVYITNGWCKVVCNGEVIADGVTYAEAEMLQQSDPDNIARLEAIRAFDKELHERRYAERPKYEMLTLRQYNRKYYGSDSVSSY